MEARLVWDQKVVGSNPTTRTIPALLVVEVVVQHGADFCLQHVFARYVVNMNDVKENTTVLAFRLPESKVKRLAKEQEERKPIGVYSPNQYARHIVDKYLNGELVLREESVVTT